MQSSYETFETISKNEDVEHVIPLLGDSYGGYRVVGTDERFLNIFSTETNEAGICSWQRI